MLGVFGSGLRGLLARHRRPAISVQWVRRGEGSWLADALGEKRIAGPRNPYSDRIEACAQETQAQGAQPLWEGYGGHNARGTTRLPDQVRTAADWGNLYTALVRKRQPDLIVEFGTAFGVSGMYFLAGLEANAKGQLLTFEPNQIWAGIAAKNLASIGSRFRLVAGTFEEQVGASMASGQQIDMAFIDAIHTREFVLAQLQIVLGRAAPGAIIILDDIDFSDSMRACWNEVSMDPRFVASAALGNRVGIVELSF